METADKQSSGQWDWLREREKNSDKLLWALRSRILTDEEMAIVAELGDELLIRCGQPYRQADIEKRLNEALLQQFRLRSVAK